MAAHARTAPYSPNAERPDAQYAFVAGLYAATLFAPVVVLGTKHRPTDYRALLRNVTERVLRLTTRPTVV